MRTRTLLTQVLVANLLVICAAVAVASLVAGPGLDVGDDRGAWVVLGVAVVLTVIVNVFLLQRRFAPLERLIVEMERADLARPRANLGEATDGRAETEEVARPSCACWSDSRRNGDAPRALRSRRRRTSAPGWRGTFTTR
jgi:hypothetical protein